MIPYLRKAIIFCMPALTTLFYQMETPETRETLGVDVDVLTWANYNEFTTTHFDLQVRLDFNKTTIHGK